jgi:hypothetical protein
MWSRWIMLAILEVVLRAGSFAGVESKRVLVPIGLLPTLLAECHVSKFGEKENGIAHEFVIGDDWVG